MKNSNSKKLLYISIFWWLFWLDKFYQKQHLLWIIKLFTFWWYGIWWIIDIIILSKEFNNQKWINVPKVKLDSSYISIFIRILKIIWFGFLSFIILWIFLAIFYPDTEKTWDNNIENIIQEPEVKEIILSDTQKKNIYYIYWQSEHIASWLTFEKYWDGWNQNERDEFFKNSREEFEKKLTEEKEIDYELYKKHAIELWYWEWNGENWKRPSSDSDDVLVYVYWETKLNLINATKDFLNKKWNFSKTYNSCISYISMNYSNWTAGPLQYATPKKIDETHIGIITYVKWKNTFW